MASSFSEQDLPPGGNNSYLLTPRYSMSTDTHVRDVYKAIDKRAEVLGVELYSYTSITKDGLMFFWSTENQAEDHQEQEGNSK